MMAVRRKWSYTLWWSLHPPLSRAFRALTLGLYRGCKPMGRMAMGPHRSGRGERAFAYRPPSVATPNPGWGRFAMRSNAAIISSPSSAGCSAALIAPLVTISDGSNWPHVLSCSAQVLSHDPYVRRCRRSMKKCERHTLRLREALKTLPSPEVYRIASIGELFYA